jgi:hypothetical protein
MSHQSLEIIEAQNLLPLMKITSYNMRVRLMIRQLPVPSQCQYVTNLQPGLLIVQGAPMQIEIHLKWRK